MSGPLVSIVTVFYNNPELVADTVSSILVQSYDNFEYIIIDDGSKNSVLEELERIKDERVTVHRIENTGLGGALAFGFAQARGEFLAYHESGDFSHPDRIAKQVEYLMENPTLGAASCHVRLIEIDGMPSRVNIPGTTNGGIEALRLRSQFCHSEMMYRKSVYEQAGGYRKFFKYSQDNDLYLRIMEIAGIGVVPEVLVDDRRRPGGVSVDPFKFMLARSYRAFAVYCSDERRAGRGDPLETYGHSAVFLRPRSRILAVRYANDAWKLARSGNISTAKRLAQQSIVEKITPRGIVAWMLVRLLALKPR